jgi:hypothetical protein
MAIGNELDFSPTSSSTTVANTNTMSRPMTKTYKAPQTAKMELGPKSRFGMPKIMPAKGTGKKMMGMPKMMSKR